ncbi:MAG: hypothetical protein AB7O49_00655 [Sphingomonadales bacterium]
MEQVAPSPGLTGMDHSNPIHRDDTTNRQAPAYPAEKARGAEIILKSRAQRIVFFGAAALGLLVVLLVIAL